MHARAGTQQKLFDTGAKLPNGFLYRPEFITEDEEDILLAYIDNLPARYGQFVVEADGSEDIVVTTKRRIMGFGWGYDFKHERFVRGDPLPAFLQSLARRIAKWLDISSSRMVEALINDYTPGSGIGWHRDREAFEHIVGISLAG